jgi:acetyl esterase/lipase
MANLKYDPSARFDVETSDVVYRQDGNTSWQASIYQPKGEGPFPGLLDVHGGAWNRGDRAGDRVMNQALAASGIVVAAIDFRLAPDHTYPAQVVDTNYAIRWFKAHAQDFNVDLQSIGAMGCSSGGHTVMLSAMRPNDSRYAALPLPEYGQVDASLQYLLCCWPVLDPYARYVYAKGAGEARLQASSEAYFLNDETMHEGNCQEILERGEEVKLPPTILIQGTNDSNVPLSIPQRFDEAYRKAGGHLELEMFPDMVHGFGNTPGPESDRAIELMKGFIARQLARATAAAV